MLAKIILIPILLVVFFAFSFLCYKKAPPTMAIIVTGFGLSKPKVVIGRGVFVIPIIQRADRLNMRLVNYPPLMRGIPRLEVGASAPWSFSFPAYEESSLQDDCNHPNLTISTGDPRRPVRFIHNEGLSFLCVRMSGCACHPFRLIQDILCCLLVPVHGMSAYRAEIRPVRQL